MAKITVLGLYNYDPSIFDSLYIPEGADKDVLIATILERCAEAECLYPSADYLRFSIGMWSKSHKYSFDGLWKSTTYEYNPIENYNRMEEFTDKNTNISSSQSTGNSIAKVTGFDSETLVNNSGAESRATGSGESTSTNTRKGNIHGNVGVTTTQEMLKEERAILEFSFYEKYAEMFALRFCLLVY